MPWKKILCPIDYSEGSRRAVEVAVRLAVESNAELVLANVFSPPIYFVVEPIALPPSVVADLVKVAEEGLAAWKLEALKLGATRVSTTLLRGDPAQEVCRFAKHDDFDLVVIGTHGRTGLKHVFLGSIAEKVVRHAACPVLVVRTGD